MKVMPCSFWMHIIRYQGDIGIDGGEGDGMLNVIDIVALVSIILEG